MESLALRQLDTCCRRRHAEGWRWDQGGEGITRSSPGCWTARSASAPTSSDGALALSAPALWCSGLSPVSSVSPEWLRSHTCMQHTAEAQRRGFDHNVLQKFTFTLSLHLKMIIYFFLLHCKHRWENIYMIAFSLFFFLHCFTFFILITTLIWNDKGKCPVVVCLYMLLRSTDSVMVHSLVFESTFLHFFLFTQISTNIWDILGSEQ